MVLGTIAFGGIGLLLAGQLKPLVNLAVVNALFVVLLLLGGMLIPLAKLPGWLASLAKALPASALADALHATLGQGTAGLRPGTGSCWWSGPWRRRWPPGSPSAGSEPIRGEGGNPLRRCSRRQPVMQPAGSLVDRADDVGHHVTGRVDEEGVGLPVSP